MKRILFIDLRNTGRSQMAEAWFNQFADGGAHATSCGTMPAASNDPLTTEVLAEVGLDVRSMLPRAINTTLLAQAEVVVLMGKDIHPGAFTPDYVWDFQDPTGKDIVHYRVQRDAIRESVQELIVDLQRGRFSSKRADWIHPALLQRDLFTRQMISG
jgi:arsenate reductase (thioredoxin)